MQIMNTEESPMLQYAILTEKMQRMAHEMARSKGFWDKYDGSVQHVICRLALTITELGEAIEDVRTNGVECGDTDRKGSLTEELADTVIRILDLAGGLGLPLGSTIIQKMVFNAGRPRLHGKKA
jgi:NTP pyrophosphatase (non-canonical NTP hydrolase)